MSKAGGREKPGVYPPLSLLQENGQPWSPRSQHPCSPITGWQASSLCPHPHLTCSQWYNHTQFAHQTAWCELSFSLGPSDPVPTHPGHLSSRPPMFRALLGLSVLQRPRLLGRPQTSSSHLLQLCLIHSSGQRENLASLSCILCPSPGPSRCLIPTTSP